MHFMISLFPSRWIQKPRISITSMVQMIFVDFLLWSQQGVFGKISWIVKLIKYVMQFRSMWSLFWAQKQIFLTFIYDFLSFCLFNLHSSALSFVFFRLYLVLKSKLQIRIEIFEHLKIYMSLPKFFHKNKHLIITLHRMVNENTLLIWVFARLAISLLVDIFAALWVPPAAKEIVALPNLSQDCIPTASVPMVPIAKWKQ